MALVVILCGGLYLYTGVWPPLVSVEGTSMYPNLQSGDLVILRGLDRVPVNASNEAVNENYKKFNGYGDVIVYSPMGNKTLGPRDPSCRLLGRPGPAHVARRPCSAACGLHHIGR